MLKVDCYTVQKLILAELMKYLDNKVKYLFMKSFKNFAYEVTSIHEWTLNFGRGFQERAMVCGYRAGPAIRRSGFESQWIGPGVVDRDVTSLNDVFTPTLGCPGKPSLSSSPRSNT